MTQVPQGVQHVAMAMELAQNARDAISGLADVEQQWKADADERLSRTLAMLSENAERYFLKTRMCLPFARRSEEAARSLEATLAALVASSTDGQADVSTALAALEKAVRTLDERSQMRGMAIT